MTVSEAKERLKTAREQARLIYREIDELRKFLTAQGVNPNPENKLLIRRNREIYKRWADGATFKELAAEFKLSATTISGVCKRIDLALERRKGHIYKKYKNLLKYKR